MNITYQKTTQLNTDIISFKKYIGILSLLLIPSKRIILNLIASFIKKRLFNKIDKLSMLLKENQDIFPREYYDWLEINEMIKYTLRDAMTIKQEDLNFVTNMLNSFFELILSKLNLLKSNNCEFNENFNNEFNIKYDEFNLELYEFKEYFYNNIYQESFDVEEIIDYLKVAWE